MSRISKWKLEKTKVKVVFRLQFHATHIPQSGWDKLFISFAPADSGKATAKTTKANVRNGTCKWSDPIYETTRLLQDTRTKQYDEKLYKLVIAMGSSRSSILGEATINLADYADALKPYVASLPLHSSDSAAIPILHVTVQLLTSKTGFREFEQQRELRDRGLQNDPNSLDEPGKLSLAEDINEQPNKVNSRVRFKEKLKDSASLEGDMVANDEYVDVSSNTSGSLCAEKHDTSSTHESLKSTVSGDLVGLSLSQNAQLEKGDLPDHRYLAHGTNEWVQGWNSDYSIDHDLTASYEDNNKLRRSIEMAESSIAELKLEVSSLQSHANDIGCEAQTFAKQLASEIASGEKLTKEISVLRSECSKLKNDLEQVKVSKTCLALGSVEAVQPGQVRRFQDLQLGWLKGISAIEDKIREIQNKAHLGYHERDARFLHPDLETLLVALQNLKQGTELAVSNLNLVSPEETRMREIVDASEPKHGSFVAGAGFDLDFYHQPEVGLLHYLNIPPGLVTHEADVIDATTAMKGKIFELLRELDDSKAECASLVKKMNQMECYYEGLVLELEENQRRILGELQNLRNEHSSCLYTISSTNDAMETTCRDLNEQILRLANDKHVLESLNQDLERRAITAESSLKRARLNYSIAVDQLQKDLELLSFQVVSMFQTSENLVKQAFFDSPHQNSEQQPKRTQNLKADLSELKVAKLLQFQNQFTRSEKRHASGDIFLHDMKTSPHLLEGVYLKFEDEICELHFVNLYLDVLSKILQETLVEVSNDVKLSKRRIDELTQQLDLSTKSKESLMEKIQVVENDIHFLNEYKAACTARCNDLALQNQNFEENLHKITCENHLLMQQVTELESLVLQYRSYEDKFEKCAMEKVELTYLLEQKTIEHGSLQNELFSLHDKLEKVKVDYDEVAAGKAELQDDVVSLKNKLDDLVTLPGMLEKVKSEYTNLASVKDNLQDVVDSLHNKLQNLVASCDRSIDGLLTVSNSVSQDPGCMDFSAILMQLEEFQHQAYGKILQLTKEKKNLVRERDSAQLSIAAAESEVLATKQKFEHNTRKMVYKFDGVNALVQKIQLDIETISGKLKVSSEIEEKYLHQQDELSSDFNRLGELLEEVISKNSLANEISALESISLELRHSKQTAEELTREIQELSVSLQDKNEESAKLALELKHLKESLLSLSEEKEAFMASSLSKTEECDHIKSELHRMEESLESLHNENQSLIASLQGKEEKSSELGLEMGILKESLQSLHNEKQALSASFQNKEEESVWFATELNNLKNIHQSLHAEKEALVTSSNDKAEEVVRLTSELHGVRESFEVLHDEKNGLVASLEEKLEESAKLKLEVNSLKDRLHALHGENEVLSLGSRDKMEEFGNLSCEMNRLKESFLSLSEEKQAFMASSQCKTEECDRLKSELHSMKESLESLHNANQSLSASMLVKEEEFNKLEQELGVSKESMQSLCNQNQILLASFQSKDEESVRVAVELNNLKNSFQFLHAEKEALISSSNDKAEEEARLASELHGLKESFEFVKGEKQALMASLEEKMEESSQLKLEVNTLKDSLQSMHCENEVLLSGSHDKMEECAKLSAEVTKLKESFKSLGDEKQVLLASLQDKSNKVAELGLVINNLKESLQSLHKEKQALTVLSQEKDAETMLLAGELRGLKDKLQVLDNELHEEKMLRNTLESSITDIASRLKQKECQLLHFDWQESELFRLKQLVSCLESEKSSVCERMRQYEESLTKAGEQYSAVGGLEAQLSELHEVLLYSDVRFVFMKSQYEARVEELVGDLHAVDAQLGELQKKHADDVLTNLDRCLAGEALYVEENERLLRSLTSCRSELEASIAESRSLLEINSGLKAELEEYQIKAPNAEVSRDDTSRRSVGAERMECISMSQEEIDDIVISQEELEFQILIIKAKLEEQQSRIIMMEGYCDEIMMLRKQCNELQKKLSEQTSMTEEFRILSVHLRMLKDKAEVELSQARDKRESEGAAAAAQDSLRIAFIKEQYETKIQELKQQLSISKKHSEEMLWKLQDALDEMEKRKKSEASHLRKNEELGMQILELEAELQSILAEKREKTKAYDLMKAEMECSLISLECCKEEKQKLEASLYECNAEKLKIESELTVTKELLENLRLTAIIQEERGNASCKLGSLACDGSNSRKVHQDNSFPATTGHGGGTTNISHRNGQIGGSSINYLEQDDTDSREKAEDSSVVGEVKVQPKKDVLLPGDGSGVQIFAGSNEENTPHMAMKPAAFVNNNLRVESFRSSMDNLSKELEKMKNENSLFENDHEFEKKFPGLQRELMQLEKANEELQNVFPLFSEFSRSGNALERVLALEMELADALQAKKKSSIHFQSSFLKQHSDEEAVFKSFRDINELIKDMLELKGSYTAVETELKGMHDRYSQLSLQFAEVEGERQKLMMTLKNVRASKKALNLNRSSSASITEHSS